MKYFLFACLFGLIVASSSPVLAQVKPNVDLVWSANTYAPAWYDGQRAATPQSQIRVTALISWPGLDERSLSFRWQKDGQDLFRSSGIGKNVLTFTAGDLGVTARIIVQVADRQNVKREQTILIPVTNPQIVVYQNDANGVNYGKAIPDTLNLTAPEINLLAEPYFFPLDDVQRKKISYDWSLNNKKVTPNPSDNRLATFAAPSGTKGENTVMVVANSLNNVFQSAKREFKIIFGAGQNFTF